MTYTVADYNVTIKRGHVRDDGMVLWGIRKYKGQRLLEWRTPEAYDRGVMKKKQGSAAVYKRHKTWLNEYKLEKGCQVCGFGRHKYPKKYREQMAMVLEFDHIERDTKEYNVCDIAGYSWEKIQEEVSKCRVLCKPCHTKHTANQNRGEI